MRDSHKVQDFSKWKAVRAKGFLHFIIVRGALGWGLGTAVLFSLLMWVFTRVELRALVPLSAVLFPLGGIVWGAAVWWLIDRQYRRALDSSEADWNVLNRL